MPAIHDTHGGAIAEQLEARRLLREQLDKEDQALCLMVLERYYNPEDGTCVYFRTLVAESGLPLADVRRHIRSAADKGLAEYHKGLWSEDGVPAGAGYCLTEEGLEYLKDYRAAEREPVTMTYSAGYEAGVGAAVAEIETIFSEYGEIAEKADQPLIAQENQQKGKAVWVCRERVSKLVQTSKDQAA